MSAQASDPGAEADFRHAVEGFAKPGAANSRELLEAFLAHHPEAPVRPTVVALLARLALAEGDTARASSILAGYGKDLEDDPGVQFVRGVTEARLGHFDRALTLLKPFLESGPPSMADAAPEEAEMTLRASAAQAFSATGQTAAAHEQWTAYVRAGGRSLRESERAFVRSLSGAIEPSPPTDRTTLGPGDPSRVGLALPLSGRTQLLGEVALRGAMMALDERRDGDPSADFQLMVRDQGNEGDRARRAATELGHEEAVIALVAAPDRRVAAPGTSDDLPELVLDDQVPDPRTTTYSMIHPPEAQAAELGRRALELGVRRFAVMAPETPLGERLAGAFKKAVGSGASKIITHVTYPASAKSFSREVAQLKNVPIEAVFVADDADRLELVAPALAVADLWPAHWTGAAAEPSDSKKRNVLLLSPARFLSERLLKNAGRYVQGALLAPGFYPDAEDPRRSGFVSRYRELFGRDPGGTEAYAYDAVNIIRTAIDRGAHTRAQILRALESESFDGVTGTMQFGPTHARTDRPMLYVVDGHEIKTAR